MLTGLRSVEELNLRLLNMDEEVVEVDDQSIDGSSDDKEDDEEEVWGGECEDMLMGHETVFAEEQERHGRPRGGTTKGTG